MQKTVYAIGSEGQAALVHAGHALREFAEKRPRHNELKELGIRHAIFIADIHTKPILLTRSSSSVTIVNCVEGPSLSDSVKTFDENGRENVLPVCPDVWFTLAARRASRGEKQISFFRGSRSRNDEP